jgi:D-arabinose 1-dehydrogenase-like Zn-dependent alcohol dehydrogenase
MQSWQIESFGKPLAQVLREAPVPQGREVLLRVSHCGVCHSDVHLHEGFFDLGGGNKVDLSRGIAPPRTLGHEIAGTVLALGPDAQGVAVGEARIVFPWIGCGLCSVCKAGEEQMCNAPRALGINRDGGFATHVLVPDARYLLACDPLPPAQACTYGCSGLTAYGALRKVAPLGAGDALLLIGAGGVGLSGVRLARQLGLPPPIVAEIDRSKWDLAREAGAVDVIDPSDPATLKALLKNTGGVAAAIDFVGAAATFGFGLSALRKGGHLVSVGLFGGQLPLMPALLPLRAVRISGSYVGSLADLQALLHLARSGVLPDLPLNTRPLAEANQTLQDLQAGRVRGRTILTC